MGFLCQTSQLFRYLDMFLVIKCSAYITGYWAQDLAHAKQAFYHWDIPLAHELVLKVKRNQEYTVFRSFFRKCVECTWMLILVSENKGKCATVACLSAMRCAGGVSALGGCHLRKCLRAHQFVIWQEINVINVAIPFAFLGFSRRKSMQTSCVLICSGCQHTVGLEQWAKHDLTLKRTAGKSLLSPRGSMWCQA